MTASLGRVRPMARGAEPPSQSPMAPYTMRQGQNCPPMKLEKIVPPTDDTLHACFLGKRVQLAFVVKDLDTALRYWTEVLKVGPFVVIEKSRGDRRVLHRGVETDMEWLLAFAYMGDVQIEFIQPLNDAPSIYKEFLDSGHQGLHHVAYWPDNFEAACIHLEANGFTDACSFYMKDGTRNLVYYETPAHMGAVIEVVPLTAERTAYFNRIQRLSQNWDGITRPVRRFVDRASFLASGEGAA